MSERDAELLEVLIGQMTEDRNIDVVLGKALRVLGHAELFEPIRNPLHGRPVPIYRDRRKLEPNISDRELYPSVQACREWVKLRRRGMSADVCFRSGRYRFAALRQRTRRATSRQSRLFGMKEAAN